MVSTVELPAHIKLCQETLGQKLHNKRGLSFELNDWKHALDPRYAVPSESDTRYDGVILPSYYVDAKLVMSNFFYLSHREWLFAQKHDVLYALYREVAGFASLFCICTWSDLHAKGFITRFEDGKWAKCEETGQLEAPWSVGILHAKSVNLL